MSFCSFKNVTYKLFLNKSYLVYVETGFEIKGPTKVDIPNQPK